MQIDNPHTSFSLPGRVKVSARVVCSAPVGSIGMAVALFRNGVLAAPASFFSNTGSNSLPGETNVPCVSGSYTGGAAATVFFPPGGVPTSTDMDVISPTFNIVC